MAIYGLTTDGLIIKPLNTIREELVQRLRDAFGASIRLDDRSIFGQISGIVSELAALVWEQLEVVNSSQDPDKAVGAALDALCTLTGTSRPAATYSAVVLTLTGTPTTLVPTGSKAKTVSTGSVFQTTQDATITALSAWTAGFVYALGDRVTNSGNAYECITAGTSAGAGGPTTTATDITDNTVHWTYLGAGTGAVDALSRASVTGVITAYARDLSIIDSIIAGWDSVVNLLDATPGRDVATDEELRLLREAELSSSGNTPIDALRADILQVPYVNSVTVFVNNTDSTDVDGVPPHSVEVMVRGPASPDATFDQSIWNALLASVAAGIRTYGSIIGTATDSQGTVHTMKFSRPEEMPIYAILDVVVSSRDFPTNGGTLIKEAIVTWGDLQATGKDAVSSSLIARAFEVDGVLDVTSVKIGLSPGPTLSTTIPISLRQLATYDTSRITVNVTYGTP